MTTEELRQGTISAILYFLQNPDGVISESEIKFLISTYTSLDPNAQTIDDQKVNNILLKLNSQNIITPKCQDGTYAGSCSTQTPGEYCQLVDLKLVDKEACKLPTPEAEAPEISLIGNPTKEQFPSNNFKDMWARNVWDMQNYKERIYIAGGSRDSNKPFSIWSFDSQEHFVKSYTIDEKSIQAFRNSGGYLIVVTDNTFYLFDGSSWTKIAVPNIRYVTDAIVFQDEIFATVTTTYGTELLKYSLNSKTWSTLVKKTVADGYLRKLVAFDNYFLIFGKAANTPCVYKYQNGNLETLTPSYPGFGDFSNAYRIERFNNGVLYASFDTHWDTPNKYPNPLYYLDNLQISRIVGGFGDTKMRDILVRDGMCYVLTASRDGNRGYIYSSINLQDWNKVAEFSAPSLPYSLELIKGNLYVGLGNKGNAWNYEGEESGAIYRITPETQQPKTTTMTQPKTTTATTNALFTKGPYLIYPNDNTKMRILWQADSKATISKVEWGTTTYYGQSSPILSEINSNHQYSYTISNLRYGTKYYYKVTLDSTVQTGSFITAPYSTANTAVFYAYGDTRTNVADHDSVTKAILKDINNNPNQRQTILLQTGDWNTDDSEVSWQTEYFNRDYTNTVQLMESIPIMGCRGNHEYNAYNLRKYWPYNGLSPNGYYYSFDYGPVHYTVVDQYLAYSPGSTQYKWIENDLKSTIKPFKVVVYHEPAYSAGGSHPNTPAAQTLHKNLFVPSKVSLVLNGHNHYYSRSEVDGITHLTLGGGGGPLVYPNINTAYVKKAERTLHFARFEVSNNNMKVSVFRDDNTLIESFDITGQVSQVTTYEPSDVTLELVGNPGKGQFPKDTPCDCQARGVKEMQYYNGKIYVGYGYWGYGGPPPLYCGSHTAVRVWQIDSSGGLSTALQTSDEEVRHMFVEEGKLLVSTTDPMNTPSEAVFWILEGSNWQSASLHGAEKTFLRGFFQGALYAQLMQYGQNLMKSADMGKTWKIILDYDVLGFTVGNAISMGDYLLMMGAETIDPAKNLREGRIFKWYPDDSYQFYKNTYPIYGRNAMAHQLSRFKDGVIYVLRYEPYSIFVYDSELLFLNQFYEGGAARALSGFTESKNVIDAIVRGNTVYVLSVAPSTTNEFRAFIHSSTDLDSWTKIAEFIVPALPYAFEMMDATRDFYVGLGNRDPYEDTRGVDPHPFHPAYADPASGDIYRIKP